MGMFTSISGNLVKDALVKPSRTAGREVIYMRLAVTINKYKDAQGQYQEQTEYFDFAFDIPEKSVDASIQRNMYAKGHRIEVRNAVLKQRAPKESNGKWFHNNLWVLPNNQYFHNNVEVVKYPHALLDNGRTPMPQDQQFQNPEPVQQAPAQQAPAQQAPAQQAPAQRAPAQQAPIKMQEPDFDFDDDIPF